MKKKVLTILSILTISLQAGIGYGVSQLGPLPVELTSFSASINNAPDGFTVVVLNWTTATEVNNYGFEIQRSANRVQMTEWETLSFVKGHGNSASPKDYSFTDSNPLNGVASYRLKQIETGGKFNYSPVIEINSNLPNGYVLEQNYPNPFNPTTVISYSIPKASQVTLTVFDVLGGSIATLVNKTQEAGCYKVKFDAGKLSNGVYFYRISAGASNGSAAEFTSIKKMLLLK